MSKEIFISCKNLTYYYNTDEGTNIPALNNINMDVYKGEFLAVLGHNGSGKSTLSKLFNGLLIPKAGKVYVEGLDTSEENNIWDIRKKVGMVFQNPDNQIVATIVEEDVAFGPENMGVKSEDIRKRVDESLKIVNMYNYRKHAPHLLSGGQKQRVAIAGILAMKTNCIIFDESTAMLDPHGRKEVINTIMDLNKNYGITIVLITHHMEEVIHAHRIIVLNEGGIAMEGTPKEVFSQVDMVKNLGLDVPQVTELAYELQKEGIPIDCHIINIDEMVDKLCTLK